MAEFINTIDALGDDAVADSIINRAIAEFKDDRITAVGQSAFQKCANLVTVDIPSAVTINYDSFNGCTALASLNIPAVTKIESYNAFANCKALKAVVLPVCTNIGNGAFSFCSSLEKVDCKANGSISIANSAFGSTPLKALVIRSSSVAAMLSTNALYESGIFYGTGYIYVPTALVESYKAAANWSTYANRFRNLEEWTVDNTVTGDLIADAANKHIVHFYNSDGTPLGYAIVAAGSDAVYSGADPVYPDDSSWKFAGFAPAPTGVTADMDCYAQFNEPLNLGNASWAQISEISAEGTGANYFSVGDTKAVHLNGTMGTVTLDTTLYAYIIGFNHNSEIEGSGIHFGTFKDAAGKDICLCDSLSGSSQSTWPNDGTKYFNMSHWDNMAYMGWHSCDCRYDIIGSTDVPPSNYGTSAQFASGYDATLNCAINPVQNTLMSCLPAELRNVMKPINKYSHKSNNVIKSVDYLPLLAEYEVFGTRTYSHDALEGYQGHYAYYSNGGSTIKYSSVDTSKTQVWWLRSRHKSNGERYCIVKDNGAINYQGADCSRGIAPIFMV